MRVLRPGIMMQFENREAWEQFSKSGIEYVEKPQRGYWGENNEWEHWLHGIGCRLTHRETGEVIEWDAPNVNTFDLSWFLNWLEWRLKQLDDTEAVKIVRSTLQDMPISQWETRLLSEFETLCERGLLSANDWRTHYTIIAQA